jgi:RNA polymerase sigma-70 factor (ECF subfamily)
MPALSTAAVPDPGPSADLALAQAIAIGDPAAFENLMRRHNRLLYRAARSILKDDAEAEDAVQNAYLRAYRQIDQYRGEARLSTWLTRIVINEALGFLRKRARSPATVVMEGRSIDEAIEAAAGPSAPEPPEATLLRTEIGKVIQTHIDELPLPYRTVFVLRAVEELSVSEAAVALGVPEATIRTRFFRARERLRAALAPHAECAWEVSFPFGGDRCDAMVRRVMAAIARRAPIARIQSMTRSATAPVEPD